MEKSPWAECGFADNKIMFHSKGSQALYLINKPTVIKTSQRRKRLASNYDPTCERMETV